MEVSLTIVSAWLLLLAALISVSYELWRALARTSVGPNDTIADWLKGLPLYVGAAVVVALLFAGWEFAPLLGLAYGVLATAASIFWYGPTVMLQRRPSLIDWVEDRLFTILVGLVTFLLACDLAGISLLA
jgi:phosphatidylserine synthase